MSLTQLAYRDAVGPSPLYIGHRHSSYVRYTISEALLAGVMFGKMRSSYA